MNGLTTILLVIAMTLTIWANLHLFQLQAETDLRLDVLEIQIGEDRALVECLDQKLEGACIYQGE